MVVMVAMAAAPGGGCAGRERRRGTPDMEIGATSSVRLTQQPFAQSPADEAMSTMRSQLNASRSAFAGAAVRPRASARAGARARAALTVVAKERPLWLTGSVAPKHLDGTLGASLLDAAAVCAAPRSWLATDSAAPQRRGARAAAPVCGHGARGVPAVGDHAGLRRLPGPGRPGDGPRPCPCPDGAPTPVPPLRSLGGTAHTAATTPHLSVSDATPRLFPFSPGGRPAQRVTTALTRWAWAWTPTA